MSSLEHPGAAPGKKVEDSTETAALGAQLESEREGLGADVQRLQQELKDVDEDKLTPLERAMWEGVKEAGGKVIDLVESFAGKHEKLTTAAVLAASAACMYISLRAFGNQGTFVPNPHGPASFEGVMAFVPNAEFSATIYATSIIGGITSVFGILGSLGNFAVISEKEGKKS